MTIPFSAAHFAPLPGPAVLAITGLPDAIDDAAAGDPGGGFLRAAWYRAAASAYGARDVRTFVGYGADGRAAVALPLARIGPRALRLAAVPGCYWPWRGFPVAEDAPTALVVAVLRAVAATAWAWRLGPIHADAPVVRRLAELAPEAGWRLLFRPLASRFVLDVAALDAGGGWPRGSTLRKNRFHEKHLAAAGALEWTFHGGGDWDAALFADLARVETASWIAGRTNGRDAKFDGTAHARFWAGAAADPAIAAMMRVALLRIDGAPAAFSFDLDVGGTRYAIANSYDRCFARHSPGKLLQYRNLADGLARGVERVDWGAGDSGYKRTIGATEAAPIVDCLLLRRNNPAAGLIRRLWARPISA